MRLPGAVLVVVGATWRWWRSQSSAETERDSTEDWRARRILCSWQSRDRSSTTMRLLTRAARPLSHRIFLSFTRTMASQASIQKLTSPLKELVLGALTTGAEDFGESEKEKAEVGEWIEKVVQGEIGKPGGLKVIKW